MISSRRAFLAKGATVGLAGLLAPATAHAFGRRRGGGCCPPAPCVPAVCLEPIHPLNLSDPVVPIGGPFPEVLREAKLGALIQVQLTYPIVPPFPRCAAILCHCPIFCPVGVYSTGNKVVVLTQKPQTSNIGLGYLSAFVKAVGLGTALFTVRVSREDGTIRDVPFAFRITQ